MSFLNDPITLIATASLIIQVVVLFLLLYGYSLKRRAKFRQHGLTMAVAVVLHLVMIFAIMIPSFVLGVIPYFIVPAPFGLESIMGIVHGVFGAAAIVLGIFLVGAWRFKQDVKSCFKRKQIMRGAIAVWVIALVLGIALFGIYYGAILTS